MRLTIQTMPLERLLDAPYNPRSISPAALRGLHESVDRFGLVQPVVWNRRTGHVVSGHQRLKVLRDRGEPETDVVVVDLDEVRERQLNIAQNSPAISGEFTDELQGLLAELSTADPDGFEALRLAELLKPDAPPEPDEDEVPLPPKVPVTKAGDIWHLGDHRLLCGDSRVQQDVARLAAGAQVTVALTSPPYADRREYDASSGFRPIPPDEYVDWFKPVADNVAACIAPDGSWFVNIKPGVKPDGDSAELYVFDLVLAHARDWGWNLATEFCWERGGVPKTPTRRFKNQFEPVYQFARGRWKFRPDSVRHWSENVPVAGGPGVGDTNWATAQGGNGQMFGARKKRKGGTSGTMSRVQGVAGKSNPGEFITAGLAYPGNRLPSFSGSHEALGHAAAFPVGLPRFFVLAFSDAGDVVFDPFSGSGSTLIAAHHESRRALAMEISPAYCDVIVERWQRVSGGKAQRA